MSVTRPNLPLLTAARFVAALFVVIFHYGRNGAHTSSALSDFGHEAVIFFFVLSGFVLTYAHAALDGDRPLNVSAGSFLSARVARIVPGYLVGLAISAPFFFYGRLVSHVVSDPQFYGGAILVPLLLQAWYPPAALAWNAPAWSLSVEWLFYAAYPLLMFAFRAVSPLRLFAMSFVVVAVVGTWRQYLLHRVGNTDVWNNFYAYFPLFHLPQFVLGVALGLLFLKRNFGTLAHGVLFSLGVCGVALAIALKSRHAWAANIAVLSAPFCLLIYGAAGNARWIETLLAPRPIEILGEASYAIYILHVPIRAWWVRLTNATGTAAIPAWLDFAAYLFVTVALSLLTLYLIEKPVRAWLRGRLLRFGEFSRNPA